MALKLPIVQIGLLAVGETVLTVPIFVGNRIYGGLRRLQEGSTVDGDLSHLFRLQ